MKVLCSIHTLTAIFLISFAGVTLAQSDQNKSKNEQSLLWAISGNGLKDTSYLYGSIHVICDEDFGVSHYIKEAFEQCAQVYLEIDLDNEKELEKMSAAALGEKPLTEILTAEEAEKLDKKLQADLGMSLAQVDAYSLQTISMLFLVKRLSCQVRSYEEYFMKLGHQREKEVKGLEKVSEQLAFLDAATSEEDLLEAIYDDEANAYFDSLLIYYQNENLAGIQRLLENTEYMTDQAMDELLVKRNANWAKRMPKIMKGKPTFFVVGAGHLVGDYGIIHLLREEGYTLTPLTE